MGGGLDGSKLHMLDGYGKVNGYRYKEGGEARSVQQRRYANPFCIIQYLEWSKWRPGLFPARYVYGQHGPVFLGYQFNLRGHYKGIGQIKCYNLQCIEKR